ncbi:AsnC family transcriptional regulator [Rhizobium sp. Root73]|nr:AsnC family transcriptional regulator [Rhizobium sp. Root1204]KQY05203.1 AsnC family transcriptional regulator [Rhizobium sp. Root1334]KRC01824.1 AsnC family transcriptional regulator [Rhizobium sp. Root73]
MPGNRSSIRFDRGRPDKVIELDEKDRLLVAALRSDSRQSLVELARRSDLSRSAVHERLRRLESKNVIAGYTIRLGTEIADPGVRAVVAVSFQPGKNCDHVVPHISGIPQVVSCWSLAGPTDLMLLIECGSNGDLDTIRRQIATIAGVATVQTHVALRTHFDRRGG